MISQRRRLVVGVLWGLVFLALLAMAWFRFIEPAINSKVADTIGHGDYELVTTEGGTFTQDTLKGSPTAIFFGFTHCPEVCPTTLGDISAFQEALGEDEQIRVFFVTVDPERDKVEQLRDYVSWAPRVQGVSGSSEDIAEAIRAFKVYARKIPLDDGDYTMDHSASILLFDRKGRFFEPIGYQEDLDRAVEKIRRLNAL